MDALLSLPFTRIDYFLLLALRVSGLIFQSPLFGRRNMPNTLKVAFCIVMSLVVFSIYPPQADLTYDGLLGFVGLCITELMFGVVLGWVTNLFFTLVFTSGYIIDMQIGFGMVNVIDPSSNMHVPLSGNILNLIMLLVFFAVNGHQKLFYIVFATVARVPIGQVVISPQLAMSALEAFAQSFLLSVTVAMPIIGAGILTETALGVLIRTTPQMNMFVVGMPAKIIVGFLALSFMFAIYVPFTNTIFDQMFLAMSNMFKGMVPVP